MVSNSKTFCFDIDGVIATITPVSQYHAARPITETVNIINELYKQGHTIVLFTARGTETGIDWREITRDQMSLWGVKYHRLLLGKPAADYYIDDKLISVEELKELLDEQDI